jgi:2,3-bisphosphoglycerate-dependent phosphoglycerate mutase
MSRKGTLVLVRHGQSRWNGCNRFTGWVDVPLSEKGIEEAQTCAHECTKFNFHAVYTSALERAQATAIIILAHQNRNGVFQHDEDPRYKRWIHESNQCGGDDIPIFETSVLNERYYGKLQGMDKDHARMEFGVDVVEGWRRGYTNRPPEGETLEEVHTRVLPYFFKFIMPRIQNNETILVSSHENALRAIIKELEGISDEDISHVNLPTAKPIVYERSDGDCFTRTAGEYTFSHPNKSVLVRKGLVCFDADIKELG